MNKETKHTLRTLVGTIRDEADLLSLDIGLEGRLRYSIPEARHLEGMCYDLLQRLQALEQEEMEAK